MSLIAVDMTPVLPGGENGGAKILAIELLKSFHTMAPEDHFLLLTASWNHEELANLDGPNLSRLCVLTRQKPELKPLVSFVPGRLERGLRKIYRFLRRRLRSGLFGGRLLTSRGVDLLFCPFTAPTYAEPGIPVVSVILDMQHRTYPQFFSSQEIDIRDDFFHDVQQKANSIICISENVRQSVLKHLKTNPKRTYTVPISIQSRLNRLEPDEVNAHLAKVGIGQHAYMFYPANFWPHKNHHMLLAAYGMFLSRNPDRKIDLALTGAVDDLQEELKEEVRRMGLAEQVHFLGFLPQDQLTAVWQGCEFLIFPSLYEGFGIPVLEAMSFGKPVLCSNNTSLPEIAGDSALYFDPRKPKDMVQCIEKITKDSTLRADLVRFGYARVASFRTEDMTRKYLEVFRSTVKDPQDFANSLTGVYDDGWTGGEILIAHGFSPGGQVLELRLEAPEWLPVNSMNLKLKGNNGVLQKLKLRRGSEVLIRQILPEEKGCLTLSVAPTFRPLEYKMGEDDRILGVICRGCWLESPERVRTSLLDGGR